MAITKDQVITLAEQFIKLEETQKGLIEESKTAVPGETLAYKEQIAQIDKDKINLLNGINKEDASIVVKLAKQWVELNDRERDGFKDSEVISLASFNEKGYLINENNRLELPEKELKKIDKESLQEVDKLSVMQSKLKTLEDKFPFKTELLHYEKLINVVEYFNENNFVTKKETYTISKDKEENILQKIFSTESFLYDFENRVTDHVVKKNDFTIKTKYDYSKNLKNPDEIIFENEIKKSEKKYSSDFDYIYTVYLDEKYSIKSEYKNSIKIDESIYLDGNKIRTSSGVKNE